MILLKETHLLFQPMLFYRFLYCSLPFKIVFQMPMPVYRALEVLGSVMMTATLVYLHCLTVFTTGQKPDQRLQRHFPYTAVRKPDPKTTTTDCWVNRLIFFALAIHAILVAQENEFQLEILLEIFSTTLMLICMQVYICVVRHVHGNALSFHADGHQILRWNNPSVEDEALLLHP